MNSSRQNLSFKERFQDVVEFQTKSCLLSIQQREPAWEAHETDPLGTGTTVWDAAILMVEYLLKTEEGKNLVNGKRVLELGSGTGICGLAAAASGAKKVHLTDLPALQSLLEANILRNGYLMWMTEVDAFPLVWGESDVRKLVGENNSDPVEICLCADLIYREQHVPLLASVLKQLFMLNPNMVILWAQEKHEPLAWAQMQSILRSKNDFSCIITEIIHDVNDDDDHCHDEKRIDFIIVKKQ